MLAYNIAALTGAAFAGKLKRFEHYNRPLGKDSTRGGAALLATMRALQRKGVPMKIERITMAAWAA